MTRHLITLSVAGAVLFLSGCRASKPEADLSPLVRASFHKSTDQSEWDGIIPLLSGINDPGEKEWAFRPLIRHRRDKKKNRSECDFIPPLGRYVSHDGVTRLRFWPLYYYGKEVTNSREEIDWILFPLLFGGRSSDGDNYFAFFPLGGRIRHFLTYETFDFALWPFYQRVTKKVFDPPRTSTSILLLFGWSEGNPKSRSFHILPFYMRDEWQGKHRKYSVLWPFFHYQEKGLDTKHPAKAYGFWPLFHWERADNYYRHGFIGPLLFMGPLVQLQKEIPDLWEAEPGSWKRKPNTNEEAYYLYDVPWPLVRIEKTRTHERFRIFPFYSHFSRKGFDSKAFLIPFCWLRKTKTPEHRKRDFLFIPLVTSIRKEYLAEGKGADSYFHLWPLFHKKSMNDGSLDVSVLSLIPFRHVKPLDSVDKLAWPFWSLYRYKKENTGAVRHQFLFTLISMYRDEAESRFSIPLLYSYRNIREEEWGHDFIWKLLSIEGDTGGLKSVRLLFFPLYSCSEWNL